MIAVFLRWSFARVGIDSPCEGLEQDLPRGGAQRRRTLVIGLLARPEHCIAVGQDSVNVYPTRTTALVSDLSCSSALEIAV